MTSAFLSPTPVHIALHAPSSHVCLLPHATRRQFSKRIRSAAAPSVTPHCNLPTTPTAALDSVAGEWSAYEGTFTSMGRAQSIPDYYIPDEFREWLVTPMGFECRVSIKTTPDKLVKKLQRVLPAVSAFGDHVDVEEDVTTYELSNVAVLEHGCVLSRDDGPVPVERSMGRLPSVEFLLRQGDELLNIWVNFELKRRQLGEIRAIKGKYLGEFNDGAEMAGGSGYVDGWTSDEAGGVGEHGDVLLPDNIRVFCKEHANGVEIGVKWAQQSVSRTYSNDGVVVGVDA